MITQLLESYVANIGTNYFIHLMLHADANKLINKILIYYQLVRYDATVREGQFK